MAGTLEYPHLLKINAGQDVLAVTFTANGEHVVCGGDKGVRVWRVKDGKQVATIPAKLTLCLAVSNDGKWIAGGSWEIDEVAREPVAGEVSIWDASTYKQVFAVDKVKSAVILDVDFSPDSSRLVSARSDYTATIWDVAKWQRVQTLDHDRPVLAAKYSPQGDRIATATPDLVRVWDSNDGRLLVDVEVGTQGIRSLLWRNDHLLVLTRDRTIKQIDAASKSTVSEWSVPGADSSCCIALPHHGKFVAYSAESTVAFWDSTTRSQLGLIQHTHDIRSIAYSSDDQLLAISGENKITIRDTSSVIFRSILEPELKIDSAALDAWKRGQLMDAEALLSAAILTPENKLHVLASRALVRARLGFWDEALVDAKESMKFQPSAIGSIAKCVALVYKGETHRGCAECDAALLRFAPDHLSLFLLVKTVLLFMAGKHVDAMSCIHIFNTNGWVDPTLYVVQAYMHLLDGHKHMESKDYGRAIQSFEDARIKLGNGAPQPPLIVSLISGWKFDDLAITIQRSLCEALFAGGYTEEAGECVLRMTSQEIKPIATWVSDFRSRCRSKLEDLGNSALNAGQYDEAISQYTAALSLSPIPDLLVKRSNAWEAKGSREDALNDTKEWAKLILTSSSWKDALTAGLSFTLERFTIYQALCEHLEMTNRVTDAAACYSQMTSELVQEIQGEKANWTRDFESKFRRKLEDLGDAAVKGRRHDEAVSHYTIALSLDPPNRRDLLAKRSKAHANKGEWNDALNDANEVIELDSSSPQGYERKHQALRGARDYAGATDAFETMLSKMRESSDLETRERSRRYVEPETTQDEIRTAIWKAIHDSPPVLIDAHSGRLCSKPEQCSAFESMPIFTELICSMTTTVDRAPIEKEVRKFYRYVTFSHTWEGKEPLYEEVFETAVYGLKAAPNHNKLQMFCKTVRDGGFHWAWSDTCCIDKRNPTVLQEALVQMFTWYEGSAVTIIFLYDVGDLDELDALIRSRWNSRGWTLQEYHASKVVRIYTKDWTLYRGLTVANHKDSPEIISEMERATGISAEALQALRPGLDDIRVKLRLASERQTTRIEDAAYSLFGIFSVSFPVTYGEGDKALGRLLSQVLMSSGDTCILAWTGISGGFNSCLPSKIAVFSKSLTDHIPPAIPAAELGTIAAELHASPLDVDLVRSLYNKVVGLKVPDFKGRRMTLPCLAFNVKLERRWVGSTLVYRARTNVLRDIDFEVRQDFSPRNSLYLVLPWIDFLLGRRTSEGRVGAVPLKTTPKLSTDDRNAYGLLARLRQPFGALLLAATPPNVDFRRVSTESLITVQVKEITSSTLNHLIDSVRELDVL